MCGWIERGSPWELLLGVLGCLPSLAPLRAADTETQVLGVGGCAARPCHAHRAGLRSLVSPAHLLQAGFNKYSLLSHLWCPVMMHPSDAGAPLNMGKCISDSSARDFAAL